MEGYTKETTSNPTIHKCRDIKNLTSCGASDGHQVGYNYTNHWELYQMQNNNIKHKKDSLSNNKYKKKIGNIILGGSEWSDLI